MFGLGVGPGTQAAMSDGTSEPPPPPPPPPPPAETMAYDDIPRLIPDDAATFDTDAGWSTQAGNAINAALGRAEFDGTDVNNQLRYNLADPTVNGDEYVARMDMREPTQGRVRMRFTGSGTLNIGSNLSVARHLTHPVTVTSAFPRFGLSATETAGGPFDGNLYSMQLYHIQPALNGPLDIYICAGQSNMVGASGVTGFDQATEPVIENALFVSPFELEPYGCYTDGSGPSINAALSDHYGIGVPKLGVNPQPHASSNTAGVSPAIYIAQTVCAAAGSPGRTALFLCAAKGGTSFLQASSPWNPNVGPGENHDLMVANVNHFLGLNAESEVRGLFWCQGESDAGAIGYAPAFKSVFDPLRGAWGDFPIVIMETGGELTKPNVLARIAEQQKLATGSGDASEMTRCVYVSRPAGDVLEVGDEAHYTGTANMTRGIEAGQALLAMG